MKKKLINRILYSLIFMLINIVLLSIGLFTEVNNLIMDSLYQKEQTTNPDIKIIAIDDKSLDELGKFNNWSRSYYTKLIEVLNKEEHKPAVIGFDILFTGKQEEEIDQEFADICKDSGNVIVAMNLLFKSSVTVTDDLISSNMEVKDVSIAYDALYQNTESGYVNTVLDKTDGYVRRCVPVIEANGKRYESFSYQIYKKYQEYNDNIVNEFIPNQKYRFKYSSKPEEQYSILSFCDVINGKIPLSDFEGSIVLVGAFAEGLQDSFSVPISRGEKMFGIQVHANIIEAYSNNYFISDVSNLLILIVSSILVFLIAFITYKTKIIRCSIILVLSIILLFTCQSILFNNKIYFPFVNVMIFIFLIYVTQIVYQYVYEKNIKMKALKAFKKYVDPHVVDDVIKKGDFNIELGGKKVDIACLFVDIRGFTTISESLDPTDVVVIINEYLSLTSKAILNNKGTLDKYIGDATMAIFNAPFETEDYIYNAVLAGIEIALGSEEIEKKFLEKYGKKVSYGIGINAGKAVVGNIGSSFRMDYTAIGDTVNTAARLESNAKAGEILISEAVYEAVKDRIDAEFVGGYQFKGKKELVNTYKVIGKK